MTMAKTDAQLLPSIDIHFIKLTEFSVGSLKYFISNPGETSGKIYVQSRPTGLGR